MRDIAASNPSTSKSAATYWICALLVSAVFAAYWPALGYAFTDFDDPLYVSENPQVLQGVTWSGVVWAFTHIQVNWHPLTWLSHMLDVQCFGLNAGGHHATSVFIHAANTVLLFRWLKQATGFIGRSAVVAALFGLHPLHVESVAWIAERKDVLSTFFFLLTLMAYTRHTEQCKMQNAKCKIFYLLSLLGFALGLMSKPMVVTLPFVLLLLDYWPLSRLEPGQRNLRNWLTLLAEKVPFFALSAVSCVLTFIAQQNGKAVVSISDMPVEVRVENVFIAYAGYLEKMFWPDRLAVYYPLHNPIDVTAAVISAFGLLLVSALVFIQRRQRPYLMMGWLWFLGTLVPVIGLVQVGNQSMADRYTYVPLIGIFIALIWLGAEMSLKLPNRRMVRGLICAGVVSACGLRTAAQVRHWENSETLARHALAITSENAPMNVLLGNSLMPQGKAAEAGEHFAEALRILPDSVPALGDLVSALLAQGQPDEAVARCESALRSQPDEPKIHYFLANTFAMQNKTAEAIEEYQTALRLDPDHVFALNNLAWILATAPDAHFRNGPEAVRLAERACRLSNDQVPVYLGTLGAAYAEAGRFDDAVKAAQRAVTLAEDAKNEGLAAKNRKLLELYQDGKPVMSRPAKE